MLAQRTRLRCRLARKLARTPPLSAIKLRRRHHSGGQREWMANVTTTGWSGYSICHRRQRHQDCESAGRRCASRVAGSVLCGDHAAVDVCWLATDLPPMESTGTARLYGCGRGEARGRLDGVDGAKGGPARGASFSHGRPSHCLPATVGATVIQARSPMPFVGTREAEGTPRLARVHDGRDA